MIFLFSLFFYLPLTCLHSEASPLIGTSGHFQPSFSRTHQLIAQNQSTETNVNPYDPFADYSEFENTEEELENIYFFQNSRFLTLGLKGGLKLFTLNMAALYNLGPIYSFYLNYFFDTQFAFQFETTFSTHGVLLQSDANNLLVGNAEFFSLGVAFKYFINTLLFTKKFNWFQPFFSLGIFRSSMTMEATLTENIGFYEDKGFGIDMGVGIEFLIMRDLHLGIQYSFQFVTLGSEASLLTLTTSTGTTSSDFRPYGDWMHINALLGVNF